MKGAGRRIDATYFAVDTVNQKTRNNREVISLSGKHPIVATFLLCVLYYYCFVVAVVVAVVVVAAHTSLLTLSTKIHATTEK